MQGQTVVSRLAVRLSSTKGIFHVELVVRVSWSHDKIHSQHVVVLFNSRLAHATRRHMFFTVFCWSPLYLDTTHWMPSLRPRAHQNAFLNPYYVYFPTFSVEQPRTTQTCTMLPPNSNQFLSELLAIISFLGLMLSIHIIFVCVFFTHPRVYYLLLTYIYYMALWLFGAVLAILLIYLTWPRSIVSQLSHFAFGFISSCLAITPAFYVYYMRSKLERSLLIDIPLLCDYFHCVHGSLVDLVVWIMFYPTIILLQTFFVGLVATCTKKAPHNIRKASSADRDLSLALSTSITAPAPEEHEHEYALTTRSGSFDAVVKFIRTDWIIPWVILYALTFIPLLFAVQIWTRIRITQQVRPSFHVETWFG